MKFCKDCRWSWALTDPRAPGQIVEADQYWCTSPKLGSCPVTGEPYTTRCKEVRSASSLAIGHACGPKGAWYAVRETDKS